MKCDVIDDVKLFPTVYRRIYSTVYHRINCSKYLMASNQKSRYKSKCIRIAHCITFYLIVESRSSLKILIRLHAYASQSDPHCLPLPLGAFSCIIWTLSMLGNFTWIFLLSADSFKFLERFFQKHYQSVKQIVSRSGPTHCRAWSGYKLFAKVISRQQKKSPAGGVKLFHFGWLNVIHAFTPC